MFVQAPALLRALLVWRVCILRRPPPRGTLPISKVFSVERSPGIILPPGAIALQGQGGAKLRPPGNCQALSLAQGLPPTPWTPG